MKLSLKSRVYDLLDVTSEEPASRFCSAVIMGLICLNVIAVMLETVDSVEMAYRGFFNVFEIFSVLVFTVEYLLRLWTCTSNVRFGGRVKERVKFALTFFAAIDLLAIVLFYLAKILVADFRFLRAFRLLRLLKLGQYSKSLQTLARVSQKKKNELYVTFFVAFILLVVTSSSMSFIENSAQPKVFSSIPAAMWWAVVTLTTVGYGDVYPVTLLGKLIGSLIALLGIGMVALLAGILGSGFVEEYQQKQGEPMLCPHCGKPINSHSDS
ncbi:MAG: ion transporter [Nitrospinota bacterium]